MSDSNASITRPERLSRIATITTLLLITICVGTVAAAQEAGVFESYLRGWVDRVKILAQLAILIAIIYWITSGVLSGHASHGFKMAALGVVALVVVEFVGYFLTLAQDAENPATNSTNTSSAVEPVYNTVTVGLDPGGLATQLALLGQHTLNHITTLAVSL